MVVADDHVQQRIGASGEERCRLKNPDHRYGLVIQGDLLADDTRVAAEAVGPSFVREHHDWRNSRPVIARIRHPAEHRRKAHDLEVIARDETDGDAHGTFAALVRQSPIRIFRDSGQRFGTIAQIAHFGNGEGDVGARRSIHRVSQVDQPISVAVRQRLEEHAADHAEDGRVGADAERQSDHDDGGERGSVPQRAKRVLHVGCNAFDPREPAPVTDGLGGLRQAT